MKWFNENWFKIAIVIAIFISIFNIDEYLTNKNEIMSEIGFTECMESFDNVVFCIRTKEYHITEQDLGY